MEITYEEFKKSLSIKLSDINKKLSMRDQILIAYNLDLTTATVKKYMSGKLDLIKKLNLADEIYKEAERILTNKQQ